MRDPFIRDEIFCPGPTPVPEVAKQASLITNVYHRSGEFAEVFSECRRLLQPVFNSPEPPLILASSGTGAMEACVVNFTAPGDRVVVIDGGKFGERFVKLNKAYGCEVETVDVEWGDSPDPGKVAAVVERVKPKAFFFQANETSTGVQFPVKELAAAVRKAHGDTLICVDAISYACAHELDMAGWDLDCVVSGSQKGFGVPAGLSFLAASERAQRHISSRPRFYFDLKTEWKSQASGKSAWTPATTLVFALQKVLQEIATIGMPRMVAHHTRLAEATRAAVKAMGLEVFPKSNPSNSLTAIATGKLDAEAVRNCMKKDYGALLAGGQDQLKGQIIRLSHLGFVSQFHLLHGLAALEFALQKLGHSGVPGVGVQKAIATLSASS